MRATLLKCGHTMLGVSASALLLTASVVSQPVHAASLTGGWAPFTRCPVDSPLMTASDGTDTQATCVVNDSTSGTLQLGTMGLVRLGPIALGNGTNTAGHSNLQIGVVETQDLAVTDVVAPPAGGSLLADPADVAGGLLGLLCPDSHTPVITGICSQITNSALNVVTATLVSAGTPSQFSLLNALTLNAPVLTLPVKIHLQHPLLGPNCYIGSDLEPILLHPQFSAQGFPVSGGYNLDGSPSDNGLLNQFAVPNATLIDDTFTAPTASGCGLGDPITAALINSVVNIKQGLPAPAGRNHLTLNNVNVYLMLPSGLGPVTGQDFANGYHAAVIAP